MQWSSIHTTTFYHNCNDLSTVFYMSNDFLTEVFRKIFAVLSVASQLAQGIKWWFLFVTVLPVHSDKIKFRFTPAYSPTQEQQSGYLSLRQEAHSIHPGQSLSNLDKSTALSSGMSMLHFFSSWHFVTIGPHTNSLQQCVYVTRSTVSKIRQPEGLPVIIVTVKLVAGACGVPAKRTLCVFRDGRRRI